MFHGRYGIHTLDLPGEDDAADNDGVTAAPLKLSLACFTFAAVNSSVVGLPALPPI